VRDVGERWGKGTEFRYSENWRPEIRDFDGFTAHLTMYGLSVEREIERVREAENLQVVVGSEKVPREVYEESDLNLAVGHQPHSEIAALAVLLDRVSELKEEFEAAEIQVEPSDGGKLTSDD
jgi:tRNA (cytidine56-2'-O)-methyltransferase